MKKDERRELENGHIFGLLPDSLYFKVSCPVTQNGTSKRLTPVFKYASDSAVTLRQGYGIPNRLYYNNVNVIQQNRNN